MAKISGVQSTVDLFQEIGVGQWLRYVVGMVEVGSAVLLLFGPYASLGAGFLMILMAGASMTHLWLVGGSIVPALALGLTAGAVLYLRRQIQRADEIEVIHEHQTRKSA
ncbi:MAG: DoxX family protein [Bdellovibrionales bacterium]|nr:DoxX family protein [Bdellovibrionales bacterium]